MQQTNTMRSLGRPFLFFVVVPLANATDESERPDGATEVSWYLYIPVAPTQLSIIHAL